MQKPTTSVHALHFEDFSGLEFERLVFAYPLRSGRWRSLEWYGQVGSDLGRDIWGVRDNDRYGNGEKVCVQCCNRARLTYAKVERDINKAVRGHSGRPDNFHLVARGQVSAGLRDRIKLHAQSRGIYSCDVWSGVEFEERLRVGGESLLRRFVEGTAFPDSSQELRAFVSALQPADDEEILALMAGLFDRPAFYTPFHQESSIPAFKKAITDTIEALNTGVHRLRDGTEIRRIPSRHQVSSKPTHDALAGIERTLARLRSEYDEYTKSGDVRPCGCKEPDCSVFFVSDRAAREMDRLRSEILSAFRKLYPPFSTDLGWG